MENPPKVLQPTLETACFKQNVCAIGGSQTDYQVKKEFS